MLPRTSTFTSFTYLKRQFTNTSPLLPFWPFIARTPSLIVCNNFCWKRILKRLTRRYRNVKSWQLFASHPSPPTSQALQRTVQRSKLRKQEKVWPFNFFLIVFRNISRIGSSMFSFGNASFIPSDTADHVVQWDSPPNPKYQAVSKTFLVVILTRQTAVKAFTLPTCTKTAEPKRTFEGLTFVYWHDWGGGGVELPIIVSDTGINFCHALSRNYCTGFFKKQKKTKKEPYYQSPPTDSPADIYSLVCWVNWVISSCC